MLNCQAKIKKLDPKVLTNIQQYVTHFKEAVVKCISMLLFLINTNTDQADVKLAPLINLTRCIHKQVTEEVWSAIEYLARSGIQGLKEEAQKLLQLRANDVGDVAVHSIYFCVSNNYYSLFITILWKVELF